MHHLRVYLCGPHTRATLRAHLRGPNTCPHLMHTRVLICVIICDHLHDHLRAPLRAPQAQERRRVSETKMNKSSSRSHCLFSIFVQTVETDGDGGMAIDRTGRLHLCDLAGR